MPRRQPSGSGPSANLIRTREQVTGLVVPSFPYVCGNKKTRMEIFLETVENTVHKLVPAFWLFRAQSTAAREQAFSPRFWLRLGSKALLSAATICNVSARNCSILSGFRPAGNDS